MSEQIQVLIDGNACGYTAHHQDVIKTGDGMEVQAVFGVLSTIRDLKDVVPNANLIVLWDGESWRKDVLDTYKFSRDADLTQFDTSKSMDEKTERRYVAAIKKAYVRAAYKKQSPFIEEALSYLGIPQVRCANYEADDLAALFADRYNEKGMPVRLVTSDGDWLQLVRPRVTWKSPRAPFKFISPRNFQEATGFKDADQFLEAKILSGDKGDEVPGVGGFGEATTGNFFLLFEGGLEEFFTWSKERIEKDWLSFTGKKVPKCVLELYEAGPANPIIERNRKLVDLRTPFRPAPSSINKQKGEINPEALLKLCKRLDLYKLSSDLGRFMTAFTGVTV